ncbi:MAG: hypothetical protein KBC21_01445 [Candidatus Pacebacteria bacterium]|nr:hypothetical protein [Candidatus Paceibacterota bacterium]
MQDIRKPYTRSRSSENLQTRLERFHDGRGSGERDPYAYDEDEEPVRIPVRGARSVSRDMDVRHKRAEYEDDVDWQDEEPYRPERREARPRLRARSNKPATSSVFFVLGLITLGIFFGLYTYVFDSATITVVPKYKDVQDFSKIITFTKEGDTTTSVPFLVETAVLSKTKALSRSESRKVETKATGRVVIYNNFDDEPQKLIKNTRFESSAGKIYRINESVTVPGKIGSTPGAIEVTLYADSTGADYNITTSDFTIPGFKGTPRYDQFYAKTKGSISGGSSGTKSLVSLADINAAKDALALELERDIKSELQKITKDGYVPMVEAAQIVYEDNEDDLLNGGGELYKVTATGYLMLAHSSKLAEMMADGLVDYNKEPVRLSYLDTLSFVRRDSNVIVNATSLPLLIEGKPRIVWSVDKEAIKTMVLSKDTDEFKTLMKSIASIESAEIRFSPMWLSHFPGELEKIAIVESLPKR